jgi:hypothetical protein
MIVIETSTSRPGGGDERVQVLAGREIKRGPEEALRRLIRAAETIKS